MAGLFGNCCTEDIMPARLLRLKSVLKLFVGLKFEPTKDLEGFLDRSTGLYEDLKDASRVNLAIDEEVATEIMLSALTLIFFRYSNMFGTVTV
mmetsp:Transcript_4812/g.8258  ORF Transcript_4812/g.8258 Transcript_4812/m.8258 type:complete len:93 (-) Transcript_4812:862-1140(-)|eukprot:CAMPEP_0196658666 /NCGR_PEP_ID=MMETSP1086-20130531/30844_1 /TAXON_ID=77921 /ORGANISM="Cyanoptyche  gloeocystis , Strain SAG4.97" /LENGTH=92 /DNA_ID=CAMNT_0041992327 /DNA_START=149 /DNA_END=427 /DNA_ORIENTATION=+